MRNNGGLAGASLLAFSTDGEDGPTDAAGAFADMRILARAAELRLDISDFLRKNDSYGFFSLTDGLYSTGPTGTNVCDIQILLMR